MEDFEAFGDDWLLTGYSANTLATYRHVLDKVPFELPGTLREVKSWLASRQAYVTPGTLAVDVRAVKAYSRWWASERRCEDPLSDLRIPKVPQAAPGRIISDEEIDQLRHATSPGGQRVGRTPLRDRAILEMFIHTGMRRSELVAINVSDVDFTHGLITIDPSKNGEGRVIPLNATVRTALERYLSDERARHRAAATKALFLGRDGRIRKDSITQLFHRMSERAGLPQVVGTHEFRRRFAEQWVAGGGADDHLMVIAGWKSPAMPARYRAAHRKEQALEQYRRIVGFVISPFDDHLPVAQHRRSA